MPCKLGSSFGLRNAFNQKCYGHFVFAELYKTRLEVHFDLTNQKKSPCLLQKRMQPCGSDYACAFNTDDHCLQSKLLQHPAPPQKLENIGLLHAGTGSRWRNVLKLYTENKQKSVELYGDSGLKLLLPTLS